ncbi:MAG: anhydro-N-acetylmuramic acid kinase, partial [Legionellaceae bacterium]
MLSLGLMSGTSMDGIDAALIETDGLHQINAIEHLHVPYNQHTKQLLKSAERAMHAAQGNLAQAKTNFPRSLKDYLSQELLITTPQTHDTTFDDVITLSTHLHETAVRQLLEHTKIQSDDIDVIGYHGQTLFHQPKARITYQMGNAHQLAHRLQIPVVYDIRQNDIQHGGQGAPFAPLYHQALAVRDHHLPLVVLNCGGLANMSLILGDSLDDLIGFDTGPGNGLMDAFIKKKTQGRETMDRDGHYGLQGTVQEPILQ